jgi:hypothetical protein
MHSVIYLRILQFLLASTNFKILSTKPNIFAFIINGILNKKEDEFNHDNFLINKLLKKKFFCFL